MIRDKWCTDAVNHKGICNGSRHDCLEKGKMICNEDPWCQGVMVHDKWSKDNKAVQLCTSRGMTKKDGGWMTFLKGT